MTNNRSFSGLFANLYDAVLDWWTDDVRFWLDVASALGHPILEIGAGTGRVALPLARAGYAVIAVDHSMDMLLIFNRKLRAEPLDVRNRISLVCGSAAAIPTRAAVVGSVIITHNTSFLFRGPQEFIATMKELHRALKPGASLTIVCDDEESRWKVMKLRLAFRMYRQEHGGRILEVVVHFGSKKSYQVKFMSLLLQLSLRQRPRLAFVITPELRPPDEVFIDWVRKAGFRVKGVRSAYNYHGVQGVVLEANA